MAWVAGDREVGSHYPLASPEASGKESLASALPIPSNNINHRTSAKFYSYASATQTRN